MFMKVTTLTGFLWLVHHIASHVVCPESCQCPSILEGTCKFGLEVPKGFYPHIRSVIISHIKIPNIHKHTLDTKNFKELENLAITFCHVENVRVNSFTEMMELTFLNLSHNNINFLPEDTFILNSKLRILILDSNPLQVISDTFLHSNSIRFLSMSNCQITTLSRNLSTKLPNLSSLNLRGNQLEYLEWFTFLSLENLQSLDLRENKWKCSHELLPFILWYLLKFQEKPNTLYPYCDSPSYVQWNNALSYINFSVTTTNTLSIKYNQTHAIVSEISKRTNSNGTANSTGKGNQKIILVNFSFEFLFALVLLSVCGIGYKCLKHKFPPGVNSSNTDAQVRVLSTPKDFSAFSCQQSATEPIRIVQVKERALPCKRSVILPIQKVYAKEYQRQEICYTYLYDLNSVK